MNFDFQSIQFLIPLLRWIHCLFEKCVDPDLLASSKSSCSGFQKRIEAFENVHRVLIRLNMVNLFSSPESLAHGKLL